MYKQEVKVPFVNSHKRLAAYLNLGSAAKKYINIPLINTPELAKEYAIKQFIKEHPYDYETVDSITDFNFDAKDDCYVMTLNIVGD